MKRFRLFLLTGIIIFSGFSSFANSFMSLWFGAGLSFANNYDYGQSYGLTYFKAVKNGVGIGITAFSQSYDQYYNREASVVQGATLSMKAQYYFFSPTIAMDLGRSGRFKGYIDIGVGMLGSGSTIVHRWSTTKWPLGSSFDSTNTQKSSEFSSMAYRVGVGFSQFYPLGGRFYLYMNEDLGILPLALQNANDGNYDYSTFTGNLAQVFTPTYLTLRMGIGYIRRR